jgi:hypothetical protein
MQAVVSARQIPPLLQSDSIVGGPSSDVVTFFTLVDASLFDILSATSIRCLAFTFDTEDLLAEAHLLRFAQCSQLTDLKITQGANLFFEYPLSSPTIPQFRFLELSVGMDSEAYTAITQYLQHAGAGLQSLKITLWDSAIGQRKFFVPVS